jgi:8-oxo-dGTP pyrophosphatase MutT (NUDIX family)
MPFTVETAIEFVNAFPLGEEDKSRELTLALLQHTPQPLSRDQFTPGHLTCTGIVLHPDLDSFLLIHHRRLDRWLAPGGHVEPEDESPQAAAAREVLEETEVPVLRGAAYLTGMDVHGIPAKGNEPYHLHHDLKFAFVAATAEIAVTSETRGVVWCPFDDTSRYTVPPSIVRAACRAQSFLRTKAKEYN